MSEPLVVVDTSEILAGKQAEVRAVLEELVDFVESSEVEILAYAVYFDEAGRTMTVVQAHPDTASMELHMQLAAPIFRRFAGLLQLRRVDFYGTPSRALLERMREKAQLLGGAEVVVNELQAGFFRLAVPCDTAPSG